MYEETNKLLQDGLFRPKSISCKHTDKKDCNNTDNPWEPMKYFDRFFHFNWFKLIIGCLKQLNEVLLRD